MRLEDITLTFGGKPLLEAVSFSVHAGERMALVGRNGSGKSTLLKIAAGLVEPSSGTVTTERNATLRYLPQAPDFGDRLNLHDYVASGLGPLDDPFRADMMLDALGLDPARAPTGLSGGEARRAALARTLAPRPDILLLDEPTNHLDLPTIEWLEGELARSASAMIIISHDRRFLEDTSGVTLWLDRGAVRRNSHGFATFEAWREKTLEEEERELHKLKRQIVREEHWLTYGVTARRKRNQRRLAGLHDLRRRFREHERAQGNAQLAPTGTESSGKLIIEAEGIGKTVGERRLVDAFSIRVHRGDRIGIVGPNGAGKTTLVRLLTGDLAPDAGRLRHGASLHTAVVDQNRAALDPDETLEHFLTDGRGQSLVVGGEQKHVASYMKDFLFKPEQARTPVRELSGGEKARLVLARLLARPANLLVLDEPTNDLDMETLDLLQEMIADFDGTVLLVSHDRDFLDRTVNAVIAPDPERPGRWLTYAGGYSDMVAQRGNGAGKGEAGKGDAGKAARREKSEPRKNKPQKPAAAPARLSFKHKHALKTLPGEIEAATAEIAALEAKMARPDFFARDPDGFARAAERLETLQRQKAEKEEKWLEIELLREELEG